MILLLAVAKDVTGCHIGYLIFKKWGRFCFHLCLSWFFNWFILIIFRGNEDW